MATKNFFDLLGDDENEDPSQVVLRANSIPAEAKPAAGVVKKPAFPAEAGERLFQTHCVSAGFFAWF
jgi:plasminogen activator inhibitor 1 RNA-binding protein